MQIHDFEPNQPFWLVWNERGGVPTYKHLTPESARAEAERLARLNPGGKFHVLAALGHCAFNAVNWTEVQKDFIPF
jgi:hypothetical protein